MQQSVYKTRRRRDCESRWRFAFVDRNNQALLCSRASPFECARLSDGGVGDVGGIDTPISVGGQQNRVDGATPLARSMCRLACALSFARAAASSGARDGSFDAAAARKRR